MHFQNFPALMTWLRGRLKTPGYTEIGAVEPLQAGFFRHGALNLPYAIGVKNAMITTDSPAQIYQRVEGWFNSLIGRTGGGLLIFVYSNPPWTIPDEVAKVGNGLVMAGVYDIVSGKELIPGYWRGDVLGE